MFIPQFRNWHTALGLSSVLVLALLVSGCGMLAAARPPTATLPPAPTFAPVVVETATLAAAEIPTVTPLAPAAQEPSPTSQPQPTEALSPTPAASLAPTLTPLPTLTPASAAASPRPATGVAFTNVKVAFISVGDNGQTGPLAGCGDSVILVQRNVAPTSAPLTAALKDLLSQHDRNYWMSDLYNALYQSRLEVEKVTIDNGVATIRLTGQVVQGGECDSPRIKAQLTQTALQFSTVRSAAIFINGTPIDTVLSLK